MTNKKRAMIKILPIILILICLSFAVFKLILHSNEITPLEVVEVQRYDFDLILESNIVWFPDTENSFAILNTKDVPDDENDAIHQEMFITKINFKTGDLEEYQNLYEYGIEKGNGLDFYWVENGKYLITYEGGVFDFLNREGYYLQDDYDNKEIKVLGTSDNEPKLLIYIDGVGLSFFDLQTKEFSTIQIPSEIEGITYNALALSHDGAWIAQSCYDPNHIPENLIEGLTSPKALYIFNPESGAVVQIAEEINAEVQYAAFSPDDAQLIWLTRDENMKQSIFLANIDGTGVHEIFSTDGLPDTSNNILSNIVWAPDGKRLIYIGSRDVNELYPIWELSLGNR